MLKTMTLLATWVGSDAVSGGMNMAFLGAGAGLLLFLIFRLPRTWSGSLAFVLIGLAVAMTLVGLTIPAKRFHFFQYALPPSWSSMPCVSL